MDSAALLFTADEPHEIVWASNLWCSACGFDVARIVGMSIMRLGGPETDMGAVAKLMRAVRAGEPIKDLFLISYDQARRPFSHHVAAVPLRDAFGKMALVRATSSSISRRGVAAAPSADRRPAPRAAPPAPAARLCRRLRHVARRVLGVVRHGRRAAPSVALSERRGTAVHPALPLVHPEHLLPALPEQAVVLLTTAAPPHYVVWASEAWLALCGFSACEVAGRAGLCYIHGEASSRAAVANLTGRVQRKEPIKDVRLINYDKAREPFSHALSVDTVRCADGSAYLRASSQAIYRRLRQDVDGDDDEAGGCLEGWGEAFESFFSSWHRQMHVKLLA